MKRDEVTELLTGREQSVAVIGKILVYGKGSTGVIMIAGAVLSDEELIQDVGVTGGEPELWECEIILQPRRKLAGFHSRGCTVNSALTGGYEKPENWEKEIWRRDDCKAPPFEGKESE